MGNTNLWAAHIRQAFPPGKPGAWRQAASIKHQDSQASSGKHQALRGKHQASSRKRQAPGPCVLHKVSRS